MIISRFLCILLPLLPCYVAKNENTTFDLSSSIADMEVLLQMEKMLIERIHNYALDLNFKLKTIKDALKIMQMHNKMTQKNIQKRLENLVQSFSLIRRLQHDWTRWLDYANKSIGIDFVNEMYSLLKHSPTLKDVQDAVEGLQRIQIVYDLHIDDMATGKLINRRDGTKLSALDLNAIGMMLFKLGCHENAVFWLESSLRVKFDEERYLQVFRTGIQRLYDDYKTIAIGANKSFKHLTVIQAVSRGSYQGRKINSPNNPMIKDLNLELAMFPEQQTVSPVLNVYKRICNGQRRHINSINKLFCFYKNYVPYVKIAPTKVEIQNFDPLVLLLLDVFSNEDISRLKKISKYRMEKAEVLHVGRTNKRVAKSLGFEFFNNSFNLKRWHKGLQSILGFNFPCIEPPELINYGIGGHYGLHFDRFTNIKKPMPTGNRYISMVFYLSDVELGGATIFPFLDLAIFPRKGAALLWFNTQGDDVEDYRTMHASCPVIKGSKWIFTLWIHRIEIPNVTSDHFFSKDLQRVSKYEKYKTSYKVLKVSYP